MEENTDVIERKMSEYTLYKTGTQYQLAIELTEPSPGFDVFHDLSDEEIAGYSTHGMSFLEARMTDMRENYTRYPLQSWR